MASTQHPILSNWQQALVNGLAGFLFSIALSASVAVLLALGFKPIRTVERAGIDFGMRVYGELQPRIDPDFGDLKQDPVRYVFFDIDDAVCQNGGSSTPNPLRDCTPTEAAPPALVRKLLELGRTGNAATIVVDLALPSDQVARDAFVAVAAQPDGPLVIAPFDTPHSLNQIALPQPAGQVLAEPFARGRLRLAPMITAADESMRDGLIRQYPKLVSVGAMDLPTAPALAAAWILGGNPARTEACERYRQSDGCPIPVPSRHTGLAATKSAGADPGTLDAIYWTIPPLSNRSRDDIGFLEPVVRYDPVSKIIGDNGELTMSADDLSGAVIVIGTSAERARDIHLTPMGRMAGPEILLNATRSFLEFGQVRDSQASITYVQGFEIFVEKVRGALVPAIFLTLIWYAILRLREATLKRRFVVRAAALLTTIALFVAAISAGLVFEIYEGVRHLKDNAMAGTPVDMVMPVLALGLHLFADLAKKLMARLETFATSCILRVSAGLSWSRKTAGNLWRGVVKA